VAEKYITVVSGLPRSGTSLMMSMLDSGGLPAMTDNVRRANDDNPEGYFEFENVKDEGSYNKWLEDAVGKSVKMVSALIKNLEKYSGYRFMVIFMRRDLDEIISSQNIMLEREGKPFVDNRSELKTMYMKHINSIKSLMKKSDHMDFIEISYNRLLKEPEETLKPLIQFLHPVAELDGSNMLQKINPSLYRNKGADNK